MQVVTPRDADRLLSHLLMTPMPKVRLERYEARGLLRLLNKQAELLRRCARVIAEQADDLARLRMTVDLLERTKVVSDG